MKVRKGYLRPMARIDKSTYTFLRQLAAHNDRTWFEEHRRDYEAAQEDVAAFAQELLDRLSRTDVISTENGKKALFRIYRDVRFSKSKVPYKTNFAGGFTRDGRQRRGGYYFHLSPSESIVGGGFYDIEREDLKRIREELGADAGAMCEVLADANFRRLYGSLRGDQLKTSPPGLPYGPSEHRSATLQAVLRRPRLYRAGRTLGGVHRPGRGGAAGATALLRLLQRGADYGCERRKYTGLNGLFHTRYF